MPNNVPQHPGAQQGLGAPQNPYYSPNVSLQQANGKLTGQAQLQQAQALEAGARAGKAQAEADILQGLGNPQASATVTPQEVQAGQLADGIMSGQIGQEQLGAMIQAGEVDQAVAEAAMGQVQQFMQQDQARLEQGLGGGF